MARWYRHTTGPGTGPGTGAGIGAGTGAGAGTGTGTGTGPVPVRQRCGTGTGTGTGTSTGTGIHCTDPVPGIKKPNARGAAKTSRRPTGHMSDDRMPQLYADRKPKKEIDPDIWPLVIATAIGMHYLAPWALYWPIHFIFFDKPMYTCAALGTMALWWFAPREKPPPRPLLDNRPIAFAEKASEILHKAGHPCTVAAGAGGLAMYASRNIAAGERVLIERPVAMNVTERLQERVCAVCLKDSRRESPELSKWTLSCKRCKTQYYCSVECATIGNVQHTLTACVALKTTNEKINDDDEGDLMSMAINILTDHANKTQRSMEVAGRFGAADACAQRMVGVAPGSQEAADVLETRTAATLAVLPERAHLPTERVLDLFQRLDCNLYGVPGQKAGEVAALACFTGYFQLFNHSCYPNVVFDSAQLVAPASIGGDFPAFALYALEDIQSGTELSLAYRRASDDERQDLFVDHYGFKCTCVVCTGDRKTVRALEKREHAVSCPIDDCGSGYCVPVKKSDGNKDGKKQSALAEATVLRCVVCDHRYTA